MRLSTLLAALCGCVLWSCLCAAPVDVIGDCAAQLDRSSKGLTALNAQCPELEPSLTALGLTDTLNEGWRNTLNREGLQDLERLVRRYQADKTPAPDVGALHAIVDELGREQASQSWWDKVKAWLRPWFESRDSESFAWLDRWLKKLSGAASTIRAITYALMIMVLIAAIFFVVNELKAAGLLSRAASSMPPGSKPRTKQASAERTSPADLETAKALDKPAILLRLLVNRLLETGRLQAERHLTHRELTTRTAFDEKNQQEQFARVANLAEGLLYGHGQVRIEDVENIVASGQTLLGELEAPRSRQA